MIEALRPGLDIFLGALPLFAGIVLILMLFGVVKRPYVFGDEPQENRDTSQVLDISITHLDGPYEGRTIKLREWSVPKGMRRCPSCLECSPLDATYCIECATRFDN